jgi:phosphate transport system substrate-binding protein
VNTFTQTRSGPRTRAVAVAAVLSLALIAGGCGTDDNAGGATTTTAANSAAVCATGSVSGAGATFVQTIVQQWIKDFGTACPGATVNYQAVGSGAGIQQFTAGTVDFGASDVPMKPEEQTAAEAKHGPVLHIPWTAGGIAVEYNVDGVPDLKLTPEALAGIFAGKITKWDDAAIKATNSGATLPSSGIQVVHRSDGSGTTAAFTAYLAAAAPSVWTLGSAKDVAWPTGQGAKGSDGVTAAVKQASGSIGYSEVSFAKGAGLGIAKIKNGGGSFVGPEGAAVQAALAGATVPSNLQVKINYAPTDAAAYPISTVSYALVPQKVTDPAKAKLIKAFFGYALTGGQAKAESLYYAPLPTSLATQAKAAVDSIQG